MPFAIKPLLSRIRFQLSIALLVGVVLPLLLSGQSIHRSATQSSLFAAFLAIVTAYGVVRRFSQFPGFTGLAYVIPALTVTYGIALAVFFFLRITYSTLIFGLSYIFTAFWFVAIFYAAARFNRPRYAMISIGATDPAQFKGKARVIRLSAPRRPAGRIDGIIADLRADHPPEWERFITESAIAGIPVYHFKQVREALTGAVEIEHLSENSLGSLVPNLLYMRTKIWVDIGLALLSLPILLPLFGIIAAIIKLDSPGPVFFRQERMGHRGRFFRIWKFRTMQHNTTAQDIEQEKTKALDARITGVGRFLRKTRIDELPQVFNILAGEMSWIGPRPEATSLSLHYEAQLPYYRYRHIVRPGISGWAQVNQGHVVEVDDVLHKLHFDFYYIKNFSIWLDLLIVLRTVRTMLTGFGAK